MEDWVEVEVDCCSYCQWEEDGEEAVEMRFEGHGEVV